MSCRLAQRGLHGVSRMIRTLLGHWSTNWFWTSAGKSIPRFHAKVPPVVGWNRLRGGGADEHYTYWSDLSVRTSTVYHKLVSEGRMWHFWKLHNQNSERRFHQKVPSYIIIFPIPNRKVRYKFRYVLSRSVRLTAPARLVGMRRCGHRFGYVCASALRFNDRHWISYELKSAPSSEWWFAMKLSTG